MSKNRITQHRPPRENAHAKELAQAKQEVKRLAREVARLRKRLGQEAPEPEAPESMATAETPTKPTPAPGYLCQKCGSKKPPNVISTPSGKQVAVCPDCKGRKIIDGPL